MGVSGSLISGSAPQCHPASLAPAILDLAGVQKASAVSPEVFPCIRLQTQTAACMDEGGECIMKSNTSFEQRCFDHISVWAQKSGPNP